MKNIVRICSNFCKTVKVSYKQFPTVFFLDSMLLTNCETNFNREYWHLLVFHENAGKDFKYQHLNVIFAPTKGEKYILNNVDALRFLKTNRNNPRFVPENIETGDKNEFEIFAKAIKMWMDKRVGREGTKDVIALFDGGSTEKFAKKTKQGKLDELFLSENWDLVVWLVVSENV